MNRAMHRRTPPQPPRLPDTVPTHSVACPYCGVVQTIQLDVQGEDAIETHCCDLDQGGCDTFFALWVHHAVTIETSRFDFKAAHTRIVTWNTTDDLPVADNPLFY